MCLYVFFSSLPFPWQVTASVTVVSVVVRRDGLGRSVSILCPAPYLWRAVWRSVMERPICPALDEVRGLLFPSCCHGYRSRAIIFSHLSVQNRSLRAFHIFLIQPKMDVCWATKPWKYTDVMMSQGGSLVSLAFQQTLVDLPFTAAFREILATITSNVPFL